jgi:hypothetical protein
MKETKYGETGWFEDLKYLERAFRVGTEWAGVVGLWRPKDPLSATACL